MGEGEHRPGAGVAGVAPHRFLEAGAHRCVLAWSEGPPIGEGALDAVIGEQGRGPALAQAPGGGGVDDAVALGQPTDDRRRQLVANAEDIVCAQSAVVALAPDDPARRVLAQRGGDADPPGRRLDDPVTT